MRPGRTVEDMGSRSLVGRLIEISVGFGKPVARSTRYGMQYVDISTILALIKFVRVIQRDECRT